VERVNSQANCSLSSGGFQDLIILSWFLNRIEISGLDLLKSIYYWLHFKPIEIVDLGFNKTFGMLIFMFLLVIEVWNQGAERKR